MTAQPTVARVAHTSEPWHTQPAPHPKSMMSLRTDSGEVVAFVNRRPNAAANARLIEQAPALYDALCGLVDVSNDVTGEDFARRVAVAMDVIGLVEGSD